MVITSSKKNLKLLQTKFVLMKTNMVKKKVIYSQFLACKYQFTKSSNSVNLLNFPTPPRISIRKNTQPQKISNPINQEFYFGKSPL